MRAGAGSRRHRGLGLRPGPRGHWDGRQRSTLHDSTAEPSAELNDTPFAPPEMRSSSRERRPVMAGMVTDVTQCRETMLTAGGVLAGEVR